MNGQQKDLGQAPADAGARIRKPARKAFRDRFRAHLAAILGDDGVLLLPTMPDVAPRIADSDEALEDYRNRAIRLLCVAGFSGCPQLSLPLARRDGAPLGISLLGPAGSDRSLVRLAEAIAATLRERRRLRPCAAPQPVPRHGGRRR